MRRPETPEFDSPLPMSQFEMRTRGWGDELDVLLITGDAYVDHPSFGTALIGRWLQANGYRVGIVAQPRWNTPEDILQLGRPRLFVGISAGALDSMLAHYTAFRKLRHDDAYTPGGRHGARPNRACIVYTSLVRHAFPGLPVVLGGIEASLRRATHYDFWTDRLRRSILLESKADLVVYGMGERAVLEIAKRLDKTPGPASLEGIAGTAFVTKRGSTPLPADARVVELPSHEAIEADARQLLTASRMMEVQVQAETHWLAQQSGERRVLFAPPAEPLNTDELDALYALPFTRLAHPSYRDPVPAAEMIAHSIASHRGCAGGCSFCSLALHQGRRIRSRSAGSIEREVRVMTRTEDWTGAISDVGGPSANMWGARCTADPRTCLRDSCLAPQRCPHFQADQAELARLLHRVSRLPGVRHLRVASGIRHDLAIDAPDYVRDLTARYVGGQLKLAPEHSSDKVLRLMRKPGFEVFEEFLAVFERISRDAGREQYVVPYLMSAFPGCTDDDMRALSRWLKARGWTPQQVQCFIPTPGTMATAMYYAKTDPEGNPIYVARTDAERLHQHRILVPSLNAPPPKSPRSDGNYSKGSSSRKSGR